MVIFIVVYNSRNPILWFIRFYLHGIIIYNLHATTKDFNMNTPKSCLANFSMLYQWLVLPTKHFRSLFARMIHRPDLLLNLNRRHLYIGIMRSTCLSRGDLITVFCLEFDVNFARGNSNCSGISTLIIYPFIPSPQNIATLFVTTQTSQCLYTSIEKFCTP